MDIAAAIDIFEYKKLKIFVIYDFPKSVLYYIINDLQ